MVGRAAEFQRVSAGFTGRALVLDGEPGIGKTTLWEAGIEAARAAGLRVLVARPSGAEAQLSFAALIDLCEALELSALPAPQRVALEVALLRRSPTGEPPQPHAIGLGLRNALAACAPVVVAIDDIQWLDSASAEALAFAARRLDGDAVGFLFARRPGPTSAVERALERRSLERLPVGPSEPERDPRAVARHPRRARPPDRRGDARQPAVRAGGGAGAAGRGRRAPGPRRGRGHPRHARRRSRRRAAPPAARGRA